VGCSSCGRELSPGGRTSKMISDDCTNANGKVLIKGVGEHLLPAAQAYGP
jgi:DNA-directed RNA polymerase subunit RPC12/RpoP